MSIGDKIKELRKKKGLTQPAFASALEKSVRMVQKYENNEVVPSVEQIEQISKVLDVTPADIMGWDYFDKKIDGNQLQASVKFISYLESVGYIYVDDMVVTEWGENPDGSRYAMQFDDTPSAPCCSIVKDNTISSFTNEQFESLQSKSKDFLEGTILLQSQKTKKPQ